MSIDDPSGRINEFLAATEQVARRLDVNPQAIPEALPKVLGVDDQTAVMLQRLSPDQMVEALRMHQFRWPILLGEVELEKSIIPTDVPQILNEATAKHKGEI